MRAALLFAVSLCAGVSSGADTGACTITGLATRIQQVQSSVPNNAGPAKTLALICSNPCKALSEWRKFAATFPAPPASDATAVAETLAEACRQSDYLGIAGELAAQRRFEEALAVYRSVPPAGIPELAEQARDRAVRITKHKFNPTLPPLAVQKLEEQRRPKEAYQMLSGMVPENDNHRKNLVALLAATAAGEALEARHDFSGAQQTYTSFLNGLDPLRDRFLVAHARFEIERLHPLATAEADREADSLIAVGDTQMDRGDYSKAAATFESIFAKRTSLSPSRTAIANSRAIRAREAAAREPTLAGVLRGFAAAVPQTVVRILGWLPYVIAYLVLVLVPLVLIAFVCKALRPRSEILLSIEDQTGAPGPAANASVNQQMQREMDLPRPLATGLSRGHGERHRHLEPGPPPLGSPPACSGDRICYERAGGIWSPEH